MKKPALYNIVEGGVVVVIGSSILILVPSQVKILPGLQTGISPGFLPALVGIGLIIMGFVLVILSSIGESQTEQRIEWDRTVTIRIITTVLLMVAYTAIFPIMGFVLTSAVFAGFFTFFFGARSWWKISLIVVLLPIAVWLFFEKLFRIPLPHGLLY